MGWLACDSHRSLTRIAAARKITRRVVERARDRRGIDLVETIEGPQRVDAGPHVWRGGDEFA